jgi:hypothetical protein
MDIAGLSVALSLGKVQQQAAISVTKLAMDTAETKGNMVAELAATVTKPMELSVQPNLGQNIDIMA